MANPRFSIAIVGAGPAGLTLARLLLQLDLAPDKLAISIFEHDDSATSRVFQGGTLDLHPSTGLAALKKAGLWEQAQTHLRYEGEELTIADKNGTVFVRMKEQSAAGGGEYARPEIDREVLKDLLLESVGADKVRWGKTLREAKINEGDGEVVLEFKDGSVERGFDLVVGADGAWSKVRNAVTEDRPRYSGICGFSAQISQPERYAALNKMVGSGSYFTYSDGKGLNAQRMGDRSVKLGMWIKSEDERLPTKLVEETGGDEDVLRSRILEWYSDWDDGMREWVARADSFRTWSLYELPVGSRWEHRKGFTLIGDAASLMTPFAGEGVNKAMRDALELAELIESALADGADGDLDEAVKRYEEGMFPRAKHFQTRTMQNKQAMFSERGLVDFMVLMVGVIGEELGWSLDKGVLRWVPIRAMTRGCFNLVQGWGRLLRRIKRFISGASKTLRI